jgi:hypothetical protein
LYRTSGPILDRMFGTVRPSRAHGHFPHLTLLWPRPRPDPAAAMPCSGRGMVPLPRCRPRALVLAYVGARPRRYIPSLTLSALSLAPYCRNASALAMASRARNRRRCSFLIHPGSPPSAPPMPPVPDGSRRPHAPSIWSSLGRAAHSRRLPPPLPRALRLGTVTPGCAAASHRCGGPPACLCRAQSPPPPCPLSPRHASYQTASAASYSEPSSDRAASAGGCDRPPWGSPEGPPPPPVSPGRPDSGPPMGVLCSVP